MRLVKATRSRLRSKLGKPVHALQLIKQGADTRKDDAERMAWPRKMRCEMRPQLVQKDMEGVLDCRWR